MIEISRNDTPIIGDIKITGSKSESNRLLILNKLFSNPLIINNLSNSEDSQLMQNALKSNSNIIDIHHAGTAMRFLTAYYSIQEDKEVILTGSERMKQRPIKVLVDALRTLGANITYLENEGFPPLKIVGSKLKINNINIPANISSQYITALMLIGTQLSEGLKIVLDGKITSLPYIQMSISLLNKVGIKAAMNNQEIKVPYTPTLESKDIDVESDWSSASYYYSMVALNKNSIINISTFFKESLQGDSALQEIYTENFGVISTFNNGNLELKNSPDFNFPNVIKLNLNNTPDIAQTIAATCVGLKLKCNLTGLETLKIKETDRLVALKNELSKFGAIVSVTNNSLSIDGYTNFEDKPIISTYNDHRMAMCMAPLASIYTFKIENEDVVEKSYPTFWDDLSTLNFKIN